MKSRSELFATTALVLFGSAGLITPASAQTAPAATQTSTTNSGIADIIVTAERTVQNVQKAPLTIQVLSSQELLKAGVSSANELARLTTGVDIGNAGGSAQIYVRGVGSYTVSPLTSPGVAFNIDGVYVGRANAVNGNFYDVSRIEVLKGPQGTLYGRNANGGSINLITNDAQIGKRTFDLNVEGGNYDLIHASGAVNLPIGENAAIRGAFNIVHRDGYLSNGADDDIEQSARLRFIWKPSPDFTLRLNGDYTLLGGKGEDYVYLPRRPGGNPYEAQSEPAENAYLHSPQFGPLSQKPFIDDQLDDGHQRIELYNFSAQIDKKFGDFATLTVIPAYRHTDDYFRYHFAGRLTGISQTSQKSLEVRLGNTVKGFTWVIGGYGFDERSPHVQNYIYNSEILQNAVGLYGTRTKSYAGFGQATLEVFSGFRLIAGGRYTHEQQRLHGGFFDLRSGTPTEFEPFNGAPKFNAFTYKAGAEYDISPRNLIFATYSTGYKAGGLNQTVAPLDVYQPEKLRAFEVGSRNRFLDNRLQLNFGGFYWKYKNLQDGRTTFDPLGNVNFITLNDGDATLYGANIDVVLKPTNSDTIHFGGEWTHSRYNDLFYATPQFAYDPASNGCKNAGTFFPGQKLPFTQQNGSNIDTTPVPIVVSNCTGFQVARVPKITFTVDYTHDFKLSDGAVVTVDGALKYASARWLNVDFFAAERDAKYAVVDANLTYTPAAGNWSIGLFGRNLTKVVYYTGGVTAAFSSGLYAASIDPPRTYGVRANFKFGQ